MAPSCLTTKKLTQTNQESKLTWKAKQEIKDSAGLEQEIIKLDQQDAEWELFVLALTWVESKHIADTVNQKSGALGLFQIMSKGQKGYLDEANRILGEEKYVDADCFDPIKSREIFDIVQNKHNPKKSINKAIKIHNPGAGNWYKERILTQMEKHSWD